jgi:hypothetical protein
MRHADIIDVQDHRDGVFRIARRSANVSAGEDVASIPRTIETTSALQTET